MLIVANGKQLRCKQDSSNKSIEESDAELAKGLQKNMMRNYKRLAEEDEEFPVFPYEDEPLDSWWWAIHISKA